MKIKVVNTGKAPVERFGRTFVKDAPQTIEVTNREFKALRAVRALEVTPVVEQAKKAATQRTKAEGKDEKAGAAPDKQE